MMISAATRRAAAMRSRGPNAAAAFGAARTPSRSSQIRHCAGSSSIVVVACPHFTSSGCGGSGSSGLRATARGLLLRPTGGGAHCIHPTHYSRANLYPGGHAEGGNQRRRNFSSTGAAVASTDTDDPIAATTLITGEECYQRALESIRNAELAEIEAEERHAAEQFDAMRRAHERQDEMTKAREEAAKNPGSRSALAVAASKALRRKDAESGGESGGNGNGGNARSRAAGVAVVKTISKQTRKRRKERHRSQQQSEAEVPSNAANAADATANATVAATASQEEAIMWLRRAAFEHGHPGALVRLGNEALEEAKKDLASSSSPIDGDADIDFPMSAGVSSDETDMLDELQLNRLPPIHKAMQVYRMAGHRGSAEGFFNLGHLLWTGFPSPQEEDDADDFHHILRPDRIAALGAFKLAVKHGDADAMFFVGVQYLSDDEEWASIMDCDNAGADGDGDGDGNDIIDSQDHSRRRRGLELVNASAGLGHGKALYYLALFHRNGDEDLGIDPCPSTEFVARLDQAAASGDADSLFLRGHCRYHGEDGYDQDYGGALNDFLGAARGGNADGAISAGAMLHRGVPGVARPDRRRAFELYQEAAEMGNIEGWRNLVSCYALGEGVPRCERTARYIAEMMLK